MFGLGVPELLIILAIALLLFGTKRLKSLGSDLGTAIKGFRSAVTDEDKKSDEEQRVIDSSAKTTEAERSKSERNA
ncbi:MAG: twin-arginine translocase TatA/TatE family subunit [Pseudomonadaceae bacterium]|nr:twin-arginine translocase TatA/TatE family subunit [Pseudomonadaceae bacterium]